ncbi:MAG: hypothetical protein KKD01_10665 [Proteobacteria bacterium]|nr:hypothetical protein [Pseudomonadota bacterium]MBU1419486.1 hypothetical protein [Pseudomonadota bacterium]MBU1455177.1 hypothetical protein [Pseudomonadota bacterium]
MRYYFSQHSGKGTAKGITFTIHLSRDVGKVERGVEEKPAIGGLETILLVEDDKKINTLEGEKDISLIQEYAPWAGKLHSYNMNLFAMGAIGEGVRRGGQPV